MRLGEFFRGSLERQSHPKLDFTFCISCGESQRLAGREIGGAVNSERRGKRRADNVVDAGIVGAVCDIESLCNEVEAGLFAQSECPAYTHVEISIIGSQSGVARSGR